MTRSRIWTVAIALCIASTFGCAHQSKNPAQPSTQSVEKSSFSEHDEIVIGLLEHFDFGDGTLADMSDQEFEEMIRSDEDFKTKFDADADASHIVSLFREARRRALEEAAGPSTSASGAIQPAKRSPP